MQKKFIRIKTRKGFEEYPWFMDGYVFNGYEFPEWDQVQEDYDGYFRIHSLSSVKEFEEQNPTPPVTH